jgi:hypothetical protein
MASADNAESFLYPGDLHSSPIKACLPTTTLLPPLLTERVITFLDAIK